MGATRCRILLIMSNRRLFWCAARDLFVVESRELSNCFRMRWLICLVFAICVSGLSAQTELRGELERTYEMWRQAVIRKDAVSWQRLTAPHRRAEIQNRIASEKRAFPAAVFDLPTPPPAVGGLSFLEASQNGPTAKASYFGKVDFGVGGEPTDNLLVLSFVRMGTTWLYDRADFVNLMALPEVRKELAGGDISYLKETPEARPSGVVPTTPVIVGAAKYIAKVYVFCPGRELQVQVNRISRHRFANAKEAEVVIGGAKDGDNEVQFTIRKLEGGTGKEALTVRVYLMSQVPGVKPIKAYEYLVKENEVVKPFVTEKFVLDTAMVGILMGVNR